MDSPLVEVDDVDVVYAGGPPWARKRVPALREVSFAVRAGETVGVVGESGSGKSTVGRLCLGLVRPSRGQVRFDGSPLRPPGGWSRGALQAVLQQPAWSLNPRLRVAASVAEPLRITGTTGRRELREAVADALEKVGLDPATAERYPHELSGGQRQRVSIARALVTRPRFILFDEVTSALDALIQSQILDLIRRLQAEHGFAALFISHDLGAVRHVARTVAVLRGGRLVELAEAERFFSGPEHPYSRRLLESAT